MFSKSPSPPPASAPPSIKALHPYFPLESEIANFIANDMTLFQLLATFGAGCAVILSVAWLVATRTTPRLKTSDKLAVLWFCLSKKEKTDRQTKRADRWKLGPSTFSSRATLHTIIREWAVRRTSSASCGRNTLSPTPAT